MRAALRPIGPAAAALGLGAASASAVAAGGPSPLLPLGLAGGLGLLVAAYAHPRWILALALVVIPLHVPGSDVKLGIIMAKGLFLVVAAGWLARWLTHPPLTIVRSPVIVGLGLLVAATATGLFFAPEPDRVLHQLVSWLTLLVIAQMIVQDGRVSTVRLLVAALALSGGLAGLMAIIDPGTPDASVFADPGASRVTGDFGTPNGLGIFLAVCIPCQIAFLLTGPVRWRPIALGCLAFATVALTLTLSRGAFIGLGAGFLVLAFWRPFRRLALLGLVVALVLGTVGHTPLSSALNTQKIGQRITLTKSASAVDPRASVYRATPRMIRDHPLFGVGALEYGHYSTRYGLPVSGGVTIHAHDVLLTIAAELGLFGVIGLAWFAAGIVTTLRRALRRVRGPDAALAWAITAVFAAAAVEGLFDYAVSNDAYAGVVATLAAGAVVLARRPPSAQAVAA